MSEINGPLIIWILPQSQTDKVDMINLSTIQRHGEGADGVIRSPQIHPTLSHYHHHLLQIGPLPYLILINQETCMIWNHWWCVLCM